MSLRVGFDATAAARQSAGIGRYVRELLAALAAHNDSARYKVYFCGGGEGSRPLPVLDARFSVRTVPLTDRALNIVWHRLRLPLPVQVFTGPIDVFHSPDFTLPPVLGRPAIVTIHDLAFLREPDCAFPTLRRYLERVVPRSARRASHVVAVSESTKRDIVELLEIAPDRITVIPEAVGPDFRPRTEESTFWERLHRLGIHERFILSVGTLEPRKNYLRLLDAYALLRQRGVQQRLVIAGREGWLFEPIYWQMRERRLEDYVTFLHPDDSTLVALYQAADVFVYPSLYEGFGIPPLEALACGAPVVCSSASSLPEVVGDAGLLVDPRDVAAIAEAIWTCLHDEQLRLRLTGLGPAQAARFSWERAAAATFRLYGEVAHA